MFFIRTPHTLSVRNRDDQDEELDNLPLAKGLKIYPVQDKTFRRTG